MYYRNPELDIPYEKAPYMVSLVPDNIMFGYQRKKAIWYVHDRATPNAPIPGSVGSRRKADKIARQLNRAVSGK